MTEVIRDLQGIISKYFSVEDVRWSEQTIAFYILVDEERLENSFNDLRRDLIPKGFVPALHQEHNDHIIYVTKKPHMETRSVIVNIIMFILTVISTIWAGAVLWVARTNYNLSSDDFGTYMSEMLGTLANSELLFNGALFFALPLMLILGIHELGHYFMSKRHGVDASLPFFIPIPPFIGPLGTFGAFISMREPMPDKKALIDIGAAGPIAGFIVAIPVTVVGLGLTSMYPVALEPSGDIITFLGSPLIFEGLKAIVPIPDDTLIHPTAFAGWVGILVTSMNLLPAGQLDGGHIMRALFGKNSKYVSYFVVLVLIILGFQFAGWWIFTFLILMLGTSHPPPLNDITKLTSNRKLIGMFSITMLIICFVPIPIAVEEFIQPEFEVEVIDDEMIAGIGEQINFTLVVSNLGREKDTYSIDTEILSLQNKSGNLTGPFENAILEDPENNFNDSSKWLIDKEDEILELGRKKAKRFLIKVTPPANAQYGDLLTFNIKFQSEKDSSKVKELDLKVKVGELSLRYSINSRNIHAGNVAPFEISIKNTGSNYITVGMNATANRSLSKISEELPESYLNLPAIDLAPNSASFIIMNVTAPESAKVGDYIFITLRVENIYNNSVFDEANFKVRID
jgi:Zn-dependent protease